MAQQQDALAEASNYVRPGGSLVYITCSVLPDENEQQIERFCKVHPQFSPEPLTEAWNTQFGASSPRPHFRKDRSVTLTPASTGTDGFFFCLMRRNG